jgi:chemotaxis-related protein WspD
MTATDNKQGATPTLVNCWNEIGVAGDQSCEKLVKHVHCRNCEVYAGAAQRNLQRPVTDGYRDEWAAHFRQARHAGTRADSAILVFRVGREWLALPAALIDSVAPEAAPHRVPHRGSAGLLGVVNVGGKLLPSISLTGMLGIADSDAAKAVGRHTFARLVVMQWEDQTFALPVADLHGIVRYAASAAAAPATTINKGLVRYLTGVLNEGGMHIGLLDAALIGHQMARLLR